MIKKVAVILVNYKDYAKRFLDECRDSLRTQTYPKALFQVYIVDNASSDESRSYLKNCFPEAVVIPRADGNYSAANNAGIKRGRLDKCEYFVIANMDTKFDSDWLNELVKAIETDDKFGIAQSKILLYPESREEWSEPRINSLGNIIHYLGFGFTDGYGMAAGEIKDIGRQGASSVFKNTGYAADYPEINGYASGCSFIIKKDVLDKIGGYNEEYYMYHDDLEMGWKTRLAGYKIALAPKSIMYHKYEFSRSVRMLFYMERNRYLTVFSFYGWPTLILIMPAVILMDLGMLAFSIYGGWFKTKLNVYGYFLKLDSWSKIHETRVQLKKLKKINERESIKNFSGQVLFQEIMNPVLKYVANPIFSAYWNVIRRVIWW